MGKEDSRIVDMMSESTGGADRLRPAPIETVGGVGRHAERAAKNEFAQRAIANGLESGSTDIEDLRRASGLRTYAEVRKTIDKLTLRKEYQEALHRQGITMEWIVEKLKGHVDLSNPKVSLSALQVLLKSVGMDKYQESESASKSWEETLTKAIRMEQEDDGVYYEVPEYDVNVPKKPDEDDDIDEATSMMMDGIR